MEGEVFGTGDPSPTRGREVERICRGVVRVREIVLRQSLRLPIRADTSLYTREAWALPRQCDSTIE